MSKSNSKTLLEFKNVCFGYKPNQHILNDVSFSLKENEHVCIIGANGCGKSTLVKIIVGLFKPTKGQIIFNKKIVTKLNVKELKSSSGIIFENPDNQFIGLTVQDEIAFGLENQCVPRNQMQPIINNVAKFVGISDLLHCSTNTLSGGQKQLVAIASVLAMNPKLIVLDEVTSMLDNEAKTRVNNLVELLKTKKHKTIISITHDMDEAAKADRIIVLNKGKVVLDGRPQVVFNSKLLNSLSLDKPFSYKTKQRITYKSPINNNLKDVIKCDDLTISVGPKKHKSILIDKFNFTFKESKIYAIVGKSGVGKTTLVSHFNGLKKTPDGNIFIKDKEILGSKKKIKNYKDIRKDVGLVFQFPEYQLFNDTVEKDIAFGPINYHVNKSDAYKPASKYLYLVGLDKSLLCANPFDLSNGQKRLVAIAGILALESDVVILDEPTAGLDPYYQRKIIGIIKKLRQQGKTIIIITHNMDNVLELADEVLVLHNMKLLRYGTPYIIFKDKKLLKAAGLAQPHLISAMKGGK